MPERWQDELKKLRREQMPDGVRERAEAGPRRELPSDGRQRMVAGVVAFAVFIAAGAFAWRAFGGTSTTGAEPTPSPSAAPIVLELASNDGEPAATLSSGDASQDGIREGYTWCGSDGRCVSGHADFSTYPPVSEYLPVLAGAAVDVTGDGRLTGVQTVLPNGDRAPADVRSSIDPLSSPSVPGRYVWILDAKWDDGSANYYVGIEVLPPVDQMSDVLHVACTSEIATVDSTVVRAQADGIHVVIEPKGLDVAGAQIVRGSSPEDFVAIGVDANEDGSHGFPLEPGQWSIGCFAGTHGGLGPSDIGADRVASFRVLDPDGLYKPWALDCDASTSSTIDVTGSVPGSEQNWDTIVADSTAAIPGLLPTDTVRDAGYPDGPGAKDGPHPIVVRDGSVIATIRFEEFRAEGGAWSFTLEACSDSGLGPTTAPDVAPDVAVVRCKDGVVELVTSVVRAQTDGVHIVVEAPGAGDEIGVAFQWDGDRVMVFSGSEDPRNGIVRPMGVGTWRVACYTGPGQPERVADDAPVLKVVDPDGLWTPTTLECSGSSSGIAITQASWTSSQEAIRAVAGVQDDDVIEPAGYAVGFDAGRTWRVVRDGSVVAWIHLKHGGDFWGVVAGTGCSGAGIGVPPTIASPGT